MRHNKKFNHLGRTHSHRKAMLSNMAASLILHKRIVTTTAKAKALRVYVEPLITKSKEDTTASRRIVFSYLQNKYAVTELFGVVAQKVADRPGGYTRILKTGHRLGDNAAMCFIELVDFNENMLKEAAAKKTARTRRSRKKAETAAPGVAVETSAEEAPKKAPKAKKEAAEKAEPKVEKAVEPIVEAAPVEEAAPEQEAAPAVEEVVEEQAEEVAEAPAEAEKTEE